MVVVEPVKLNLSEQCWKNLLANILHQGHRFSKTRKWYSKMDVKSDFTTCQNNLYREGIGRL